MTHPVQTLLTNVRHLIDQIGVLDAGLRDASARRPLAPETMTAFETFPEAIRVVEAGLALEPGPWPQDLARLAVELASRAEVLAAAPRLRLAQVARELRDGRTRHRRPRRQEETEGLRVAAVHEADAHLEHADPAPTVPDLAAPSWMGAYLDLPGGEQERILEQLGPQLTALRVLLEALEGPENWSPALTEPSDAPSVTPTPAAEPSRVASVEAAPAEAAPAPTAPAEAAVPSGDPAPQPRPTVVAAAAATTDRPKPRPASPIEVPKGKPQRREPEPPGRTVLRGRIGDDLPAPAQPRRAVGNELLPPGLHGLPAAPARQATPGPAPARSAGPSSPAPSPLPEPPHTGTAEPAAQTPALSAPATASRPDAPPVALEVRAKPRPAPEQPPTEDAPTPTASRRTPTLPEFEAWVADVWIDPSGHPCRAPWANADWPAAVASFQETHLLAGAWGEAWLAARAGAPVPPDDVAVLAALAAGERSAPTSGARRAWMERARGGSTTATLADTARALVEALVGAGPDAPLTPEEAELTVENLDLSDENLKRALLQLLELAARGERPASAARSALASVFGAPSRGRSAADARNVFRELYRKMHTHAGGVIETDHCRRAWGTFMDQAAPILRGVRDGAPIGASDLPPLLDLAEQIFDDQGARFQDRSRMDRAARRLVGAASDVLEAEVAAGAGQAAGWRPLELGDFQRLFAALPTAPRERWITAVLVGAVGGPAFGRATGLAIPTPAVEQRPGLLAAYGRASLLIGPDGLVAPQFRDPRLAVAHLLAPAVGEPIDLSDAVRQLLRAKRPDLVDHLDNAKVNTERVIGDRLQESADARRDLLDQATARLSETLADLAELGHPAAQTLRAHLTRMQARRDVESPELLAAWLTALHEEARQLADDEIAALRGRLPEGSELQGLVDQRLFGQVLLRLQGGTAPARPRASRITIYRSRVPAGWLEDPRAALRKLDAEFADRWTTGEAKDQRDVFVDRFFPARETKKLKFVESQSKAVKIPIHLIREWLAMGLNPSFFPQFARFSAIHLFQVGQITPEAAVNEALRNQADANVLGVLLVNRFTPKQHDELVAQFQRKNRDFGVIDTLDVVRAIAGSDGTTFGRMMALLEILTEQQSWKRFSPYEQRDGASIKLEMYVGRTEEAEQLAKSGRFSRIFSGRKLGKSALQRFVTDRYDGHPLASGNQLRVVFVGAAGTHDEVTMVERIRERIAERFPTLRLPPAEGRTAGDHLRAIVGAFNEQAKNESLLLLIDEADAFFESQVRNDPTRRERGLAWQMRQLESTVDAAALPRVRFVFTGYRVTNRPSGAWANWGDVMRLRPLDPEHAEELVDGPLARMGIDVTAHAASIAFRCGYQPAVILNFGNALLQYLAEQVPTAARWGYAVPSRVINEVFDDQRVQDEIRHIVRQNWGSDNGKLVFSALLLELAQLPVGAVVDDAPDRVAKRIIETLDAEARAPEGGWRDLVNRALRELHERSLITLSGGAGRGARLRFPHHLPILLQEDQVANLRGAWRDLEGTPTSEPGGLLPETTRADLRTCLAEGHEFGFKAAVLVSTWTAGVRAYAKELLDAEPPKPAHEVPASRWATVQALSDVREEDARRIIERRVSTEAPPILLVGGAGLLRWALARPADVDRYGVVRLSPARTRAWLRHSYSIELSDKGLEVLVRATRGIPALLGAVVDQLLAQQAASDVPDPMVLAATDRVSTQLTSLARTLRADLTPRERELLRLACAASRHESAKSPADLAELMENWPDFRPRDDGLEPRTAVDDNGIELLVNLGLLPFTPDSSARRPKLDVLPPDDPLHSLVDAMWRT